MKSASIRNPPCVNRNIAARARTWNCTGRRTASTLALEAPEGSALRRCFRGDSESAAEMGDREG
eukprot:14277724-Alexandrium_andersonii.AAC.1